MSNKLRTYILSYDEKSEQYGSGTFSKDILIDFLQKNGASKISSPVASTIIFSIKEVEDSTNIWFNKIKNKFGDNMSFVLARICEEDQKPKYIIHE
jgi:hypothetical protein